MSANKPGVNDRKQNPEGRHGGTGDDPMQQKQEDERKKQGQYNPNPQHSGQGSEKYGQKGEQQPSQQAERASAQKKQ